MRIAIAMFGIPRCSAVTMPSLASNLFAPANETGEVRLFYHLHKQDSVVNERSREDAALDASNYEPFAAMTGELSPPEVALETFDLGALEEFGDVYKDDWKSTRNLILQLYSLDRVTKLLADWDPDVVLYARPDLLYHDRLASGLLRFAARKERACVVPAWQWWGGYNDRFAICGRGTFRAYGQRLKQAVPFCRTNNGPLHAEALLRFSLQRARAVMASTRLRASRVRVGGEVVDEIFLARKALGSRGRISEMVLCALRGRLAVLAG